MVHTAIYGIKIKWWCTIKYDENIEQQNQTNGRVRYIGSSCYCSLDSTCICTTRTISLYARTAERHTTWPSLWESKYAGLSRSNCNLWIVRWIGGGCSDCCVVRHSLERTQTGSETKTDAIATLIFLELLSFISMTLNIWYIKRRTSLGRRIIDLERKLFDICKITIKPLQVCFLVFVIQYIQLQCNQIF